MNNNGRVKIVAILVAVISAVIIQSCSDAIDAKQSLSTIHLDENERIITTSETGALNPTGRCVNYEQLSVEVDKEENIFNIKSRKDDKDLCLKGKLLSYDSPNTANIYRIVRSADKSAQITNSIEGWTLGFFQSGPLLTGYGKYNEETNTYVYLSPEEKNSVNDSITRLKFADLKNMERIQSAFPGVEFGDCVLKITYPATSSDLYEYETFDTTIVDEYVFDTIKGRSFNLYIIRRELEGILVGLPSNTCMHYLSYDEKNKMKTEINSENLVMFYDGEDIYEIHCCFENEKNVEIHLKDQPVLSFEQALDRASKELYDFVCGAINAQQDPYIYAAELVYLTVNEYDMSNVEGMIEYYTVSDTYESYLYPFWVFYTHTNYKTGGADCGDQQPIMVNAVTGKVHLCN